MAGNKLSEFFSLLYNWCEWMFFLEEMRERVIYSCGGVELSPSLCNWDSQMHLVLVFWLL